MPRLPGSLAAEHLIALGHRPLGFLGPATAVWAFRMRERGFVQALRAAGLSIRASDLRRAPPTVDGGLRAMKDMLALPGGPSGVFCANDLMAFGALNDRPCQRGGAG